MALITHDNIRTAAIATLQADTALNAATQTWLRYLLDTGKIAYPAIYVGTITQPFDGSCGTTEQRTSATDPMTITAGVLSNTHTAADAELGTLYKQVYDVIMATPALGLSNFRIKGMTNVTTKPIAKCGRAVTRAEMTYMATWEE